MTVARQLAAWATKLAAAHIPQQVRHAAARSMLDGLGAALAASRQGSAAPAVAVAAALAGPPEATILGTRQRVSAPAAALANGALIHALDFDDTHGEALVHPTAVVLPAAFAIAEHTAATGRAVLTAAVAGYEAACRIGMAAPYGFHARGLHATPIAGALSAALVTARLSGMDSQGCSDGLGIAGSSACGLLEFLDGQASTKQLHPGSASMAGVLAARLAAAGASGPPAVLEGRFGLYASLSGRPADPNSVVAGLGVLWQAARISIKPYPSCQLIHSALDAVRSMNHPIDPREILRIDVEVHPDAMPIIAAPAELKAQPRNGYDAKFSLAWSLAALLVDGHIDLETYSDAALSRCDVAQLAKTVKPTISAGTGPAADAAGRVHVHLSDGRVIRGAAAHSRGGPDSPLTDAELLAKFLSNTGEADPARELAERIIGLDAEPDLDAIMRLAARVGGK